MTTPPDDDWVKDFLLSDLKRQCRLSGLSLPSPKRPRRNDDDEVLKRIRTELAAMPAYTDMVIPPNTPLDVLHAEITAMRDLCDTPAPPGMAAGRAGDYDRRLREHIDRVQWWIDRFDQDL